jgi:hypothetical protein
MAKQANLITTIREEELNPLCVTWDLLETRERCEHSHPDDIAPDYEYSREVLKIHRVELMLFDKYGIDLTSQFTGIGSSKNLRDRLEFELLEAVEGQSINELMK